MNLTRNIILDVSSSTQIALNVNTCDFVSLDYSQIEFEAIKKLFNYKNKNRNLRTVVGIDLSKDFIVSQFTFVKNIIKYTTEYTFDGIIFKNCTSSNVNEICKIATTINKLPVPYNYKWPIFLHFNKAVDVMQFFNKIKLTNHQDMITKIIVPYDEIRELTDNHFDSSFIMTNTSDGQVDNVLEKVKMNKLGGIYATLANPRVSAIQKDWFADLRHTIPLIENNIIYPTSKTAKQLNEHNDDVHKIIDLYADSKINIQLDIVPIFE